MGTKTPYPPLALGNLCSDHHKEMSGAMVLSPQPGRTPTRRQKEERGKELSGTVTPWHPSPRGQSPKPSRFGSRGGQVASSAEPSTHRSSPTRSHFTDGKTESRAANLQQGRMQNWLPPTNWAPPGPSEAPCPPRWETQPQPPCRAPTSCSGGGGRRIPRTGQGNN